MDQTIDNNIETVRSIWTTTQQFLEEWFEDKPEGIKLAIPVLIGMMAVQLGWDEAKSRQVDPFIRYHVRNHPDWYVTLGAGGGIMRASEKHKRDAAKTAKADIKKLMAEAIAAKTAKPLASTDDLPTDTDKQ
jgi:hypothetical protein